MLVEYLKVYDDIYPVRHCINYNENNIQEVFEEFPHQTCEIGLKWYRNVLDMLRQIIANKGAYTIFFKE